MHHRIIRGLAKIGEQFIDSQRNRWQVVEIIGFSGWTGCVKSHVLAVPVEEVKWTS